MKEQRKSLLKVLRAAIRQLTHRTYALLTHDGQKCGPGDHSARVNVSAQSMILHSPVSHRLCPKAGQKGRHLWSLLALVVETGQD